MSFKSLKYLFLRELQSSRRNRGIMLAVLVFPLFLWGFQLVFPLMRTGILGGTQVKDEPEIFFIVNEDIASNGVNPIATIPNNQTYVLPFAFGGNAAGSNVASLNLAEFFIARMIAAQNTGLFLTDYQLEISVPKANVAAYAKTGEVNYWIEIPVGFATNYTNDGITTVYLHSLSLLDENDIVQTAVNTILGDQPFSNPDESVQTILTPILIDLETNNEGEADPIAVIMDNGLPSLIAIILTFLVVLPYTSATIADERDKKTMEALLALPISRQEILLGKFLAGVVLSVIGLVINLTGLTVYGFVMTDIIAPTAGYNNFSFAFDSSILPALTVTLFLCSLVNLGIGISLASIAKDAASSRSLSTVLMMPLIMILPIMLFIGLPEILAKNWNAPIVLLLYAIPWTHVFAIFMKQLSPDYFTTNGLFGDIWLDTGFHIVALFVTLVIVMWVASKIFEREGLVN